MKQTSKWKFLEGGFSYQFGSKRAPDMRVICLEAAAEDWGMAGIS